MQHLTVNWLPELDRTEENRERVFRAFEAQVPPGEVPIKFEQNLRLNEQRFVWGWYSPSCTMLFVEPKR